METDLRLLIVSQYLSGRKARVIRKSCKKQSLDSKLEVSDSRRRRRRRRLPSACLTSRSFPEIRHRYSVASNARTLTLLPRKTVRISLRSHSISLSGIVARQVMLHSSVVSSIGFSVGFSVVALFVTLPAILLTTLPIQITIAIAAISTIATTVRIPMIIHERVLVSRMLVRVDLRVDLRVDRRVCWPIGGERVGRRVASGAWTVGVDGGGGFAGSGDGADEV